MKVLVGLEETPFIIHQDVICTKSKFFKAACSGEWCERREGVIRLADSEPLIFHANSNWVYSGIISDFDADFDGDEDLHFRYTAMLYVLGDVLDDA